MATTTKKMGLKREGKRQQEEEEEGGGGFTIQKLRNREAIRVFSGSSTPPPIWRLEASSSQHHRLLRYPFHEFLLDFPTTTISARKLCACLWQSLPNQTAPLRRGRGRRRRRHNGLFQQPTSSSSLRRQVAGSFAQHHRSVEPNYYATQPVNSSNHCNFAEPASASSLSRQVAVSFARHHRSNEPNYNATLPVHSSKHCNLAEAAQCNCKVTPTSTLEVKGRIRESSCNHKTSRELLKVLNRIQSIREQHASNISVVEGLKVELDLSRAQIKEFRREKQMKILMKQMAEDKFAVQSAAEELEDERRSRRHSEILHWRLSQELSEVKSLFHGSLRELERERRARILLENLCDEFAIRIRDYEQESHSLKQKKNDDVGADRNNHDRLILDISKAWLHERMQMKVEKAGDDLVEMINAVVDRLGFDIETFLRTRRSVNLRKYGNSPKKEIRETHPCHYNSFPIKEPISAPVSMHEDDTTNAENFGATSGEGHGNNSSVDQDKKGRQISTGKQVKTSDKTPLVNRLRYQLFMRNQNKKVIIGP